MSVRLARASAEKIVAAQGVTGAPIDVRRIAAGLNLSILTETLGEGISGLLVRKSKKHTYICVAEGDVSVRQRFTIAHEIGHHVLRHDFDEGAVHADHGHVIGRRAASGAPSFDQREYEANQFAAALLMPTKLLKEAATRATPSGVIMEHHIDNLAAEFEVSAQAMTIRLKNMGLL